MQSRELLKKIIEAKKFALLSTLLESKEAMYLKEIAQASQVPMASAYRILHDLCAQQLVEKKQWKTSIVYLLPENPTTQLLKSLLKEKKSPLDEFLQVARKIPQVEQVLSYQANKKTNILVLGHNINMQELHKIANQHSNLSVLALTPEQYKQMGRMGLYAGEKKVLFVRN